MSQGFLLAVNSKRRFRFHTTVSLFSLKIPIIILLKAIKSCIIVIIRTALCTFSFRSNYFTNVRSQSTIICDNTAMNIIAAAQMYRYRQAMAGILSVLILTFWFYLFRVIVKASVNINMGLAPFDFRRRINHKICMDRQSIERKNITPNNDETMFDWHGMQIESKKMRSLVLCNIGKGISKYIQQGKFCSSQDYITTHKPTFEATFLPIGDSIA